MTFSLFDLSPISSDSVLDIGCTIPHLPWQYILAGAECGCSVTHRLWAGEDLSVSADLQEYYGKENTAATSN
jgi:hypothetical protein